MRRWCVVFAAWLVLHSVAYATTGSAPPKADLASAVAAEAKARGFSGTVLITEHGKTRVLRSFGMANRAFGVSAQPADRYRIASITKLFTSVLILMLVDEGRLTLDTKVADAFPGYGGGGGREVTIRSLLNHTSGLPQLDTIGSLDEAFAKGLPLYQTPQTAGSLLAACCTGALVNQPGAKFDYNNADYILLGRIIEAQEGAPYAEVLQRRILGPLKLANTGMAQHAAIIPRLTPSYFWLADKRRWMNDLPFYYENWDAAGGMYSSAADLGAFAEALFRGRLVRADSLAQMLKPGLDDYGLGLWTYSFEAGGRAWRVAKRPGRIMGVNTQLYRLLDRDATIILLGNTNHADTDLMVQALARRMVQP
jgi:D-alanyl-D-alanine carboxypeptidase